MAKLPVFGFMSIFCGNIDTSYGYVDEMQIYRHDEGECMANTYRTKKKKSPRAAALEQIHRGRQAAKASRSKKPEQGHGSSKTGKGAVAADARRRKLALGKSAAKNLVQGQMALNRAKKAGAARLAKARKKK